MSDSREELRGAPKVGDILETGLFAGFEVLHVYTRAEAIADGVLVDLMQGETGDICRRFYKYPVAVTSAVWALVEEASKTDSWFPNTRNGVVHDILFMSLYGVTRRLGDSGVLFKVHIQGTTPNPVHELKLLVGPGDDGESVITILLPEED